MNRSDLTRFVAKYCSSAEAKILVAVSGGVDSVVLLHLLKGVVPELGPGIEVVHMDHGIRPESGRDAQFVEDLCGQWGIPCHLLSRNVTELARQNKTSLETAGRDARREAFTRLATAVGADFIALAHHRDDQVETFLMRLFRGSGLSGLACMPEVQGLFWRPLLHYSRRQILDYAQQHHLLWVEDSSNQDTVFTRNRVRQKLMPQIDAVHPLAREHIALTVQQFQAEEDYWRTTVTEAFENVLESCSDGLRMQRLKLIDLHPALRLRVYREGLRQVRGDLQRIESVHLQAIEAMLIGTRSQLQVDLPGGWVARRYNSLWFRAAPPEPVQPFSSDFSLPGELLLPGGKVLRAVLQSEQEGESRNAIEFSFNQLTQPLSVRSCRPGDRFKPLGMSGHKKLKRFFSDQQVELEERAKTLVLLHGETILWVIGQRRSAHAVVDAKTAQILRLELI